MIINVGSGGADKAKSVKYDNSVSKLSATDTQGAIDEVVGKVNDKVDKVDGKGLSTNDYTATEKSKLAGIATGATKNVIDSSLSTSSTNAVQNKVVTAKLNTLTNNLGGLRFGVDGDGNYGYYGADDSLIPFKIGDEAEIFHGLTSYTFESDYKVVYAISHRGNTTVPDMLLNNVKQEYISSIRGNSTASGTCILYDIKSGDVVSTTGAVTVICFK